MMESNLKVIIDDLEKQKQSKVKLMKVSQIKEEIKLISSIDYEARALERTEEKLIQRLKDTYAM